MRLADLPTPALVLDRGILERNCTAMGALMQGLGVRLRPHLKTAKSAEVAAIATRGQFGGITVSTLAEARYFAAHGFRDILYAVGLAPQKVDEIAALQRDGVALTAIADNLDAVRAIAARARSLEVEVPLMVEIDVGAGRGGVAPDSNELVPLGHAIHMSGHLSLAGVLTHAGQSYFCRSAEEIAAVAKAERAGIVVAANRLKSAGLPCPVISAGSTPTAVFARSLAGVTEMRPGVYTLFDLDQATLGTCRIEDIAATVLATVIGHNRRAGKILIDAGILALSKDRSAGDHEPAIGYGLVCPAAGTEPFDGICVSALSQEHGHVTAQDGEPPWEALPIGSRVRILPNHACITAAAYGCYHVVDGDDEVVARWERVNGW